MTACRHGCPRHFEKNENRKEKSGNLFRESVICQSLKTVEYGSRGKAGGQTAGSDVPEPCRTVIGFRKAGAKKMRSAPRNSARSLRQDFCRIARCCPKKSHRRFALGGGIFQVLFSLRFSMWEDWITGGFGSVISHGTSFFFSSLSGMKPSPHLQGARMR